MEHASDPSAYPFVFACLRSGNCCAIPDGVVRITARDEAAMAEHLGLTAPAFRSRYVQRGTDRLKDGLGGRCVFLREGRAGAACEVYPARPTQCRTWPYWPELLRSPERLQAALRTCPGITLLDASMRPRQLPDR
ncbi:MAG: YkgJ family cysteine cluster protein [Planctomycetota bacterium]